MRFLLLETEHQHDSDTAITGEAGRAEDVIAGFEKEWKTADKKRREVLMRQMLQRMGDSPQERQRLLKLVNPFRTSCYKFGIERNKNPFIRFFEALAKTKLKFDAQQVSNINTLVMMTESELSLRRRVDQCGRSNNSKEYLLQPSLYYRNAKDFAYTMQIFETVLNPSKLSKFFKDTSDISVEQLFIENNTRGKIKPAGNESTAKDINTIYGQVEAWAGEDGENDLDGQDADFALDDKKDSSKTSDKSKKPKETRLTQAQLERIKKSRDKHFTSLEAADKAGIKDGEVVYIDFNKDMAVGGMGNDNWVDTWMVRKKGKWMKYA